MNNVLFIIEGNTDYPEIRFWATKDKPNPDEGVYSYGTFSVPEIAAAVAGAANAAALSTRRTVWNDIEAAVLPPDDPDAIGVAILPLEKWPLARNVVRIGGVWYAVLKATSDAGLVDMD